MDRHHVSSTSANGLLRLLSRISFAKRLATKRIGIFCPPRLLCSSLEGKLHNAIVSRCFVSWTVTLCRCIFTKRMSSSFRPLIIRHGCLPRSSGSSEQPSRVEKGFWKAQLHSALTIPHRLQSCTRFFRPTRIQPVRTLYRRLATPWLHARQLLRRCPSLSRQ